MNHSFYLLFWLLSSCCWVVWSGCLFSRCSFAAPSFSSSSVSQNRRDFNRAKRFKVTNELLEDAKKNVVYLRFYDNNRNYQNDAHGFFYGRLGFVLTYGHAFDSHTAYVNVNSQELRTASEEEDYRYYLKEPVTNFLSMSYVTMAKQAYWKSYYQRELLEDQEKIYLLYSGTYFSLLYMPRYRNVRAVPIKANLAKMHSYSYLKWHNIFIPFGQTPTQRGIIYQGKNRFDPSLVTFLYLITEDQKYCHPAVNADCTQLNGAPIISAQDETHLNLVGIQTDERVSTTEHKQSCYVITPIDVLIDELRLNMGSIFSLQVLNAIINDDSIQRIDQLLDD